MVAGAAARGPLPDAARGYSRFGEHALGWLLVSGAAALVDRPRRAVWARAALAAAAAHASAIVIKRIVRRRRPSDERIRVLSSTPSDLSFPSAHAASTTAALVAMSPIIGKPAAAGAAVVMGLGRILLGVHYPTDVLAGGAAGLLLGRWAKNLEGRRGGVQ